MDIQRATPGTSERLAMARLVAPHRARSSAQKEGGGGCSAREFCLPYRTRTKKGTTIISILFIFGPLRLQEDCLPVSWHIHNGANLSCVSGPIDPQHTHLISYYPSKSSTSHLSLLPTKVDHLDTRTKPSITNLPPLSNSRFLQSRIYPPIAMLPTTTRSHLYASPQTPLMISGPWLTSRVPLPEAMA